MTRIVTFRKMEAACSSETSTTKYNTTRCRMVKLSFCLINNHAPDDVLGGVVEVQIHALSAPNVGEQLHTPADLPPRKDARCPLRKGGVGRTACRSTEKSLVRVRNERTVGTSGSADRALQAPSPRQGRR